MPQRPYLRPITTLLAGCLFSLLGSLSVRSQEGIAPEILDTSVPEAVENTGAENDAIAAESPVLLSLETTEGDGNQADVPKRWWDPVAYEPILNDPLWVSFDLRTLVVDALENNPRIAAVTHRAAGALERIIQEDAVFDPSLLLESKYASTNDPVGNSLTTGGPPRLVEDSWNNRAGFVKTRRDGTQIDISQQFGLLDSNSLFFEPANQGNTRMNLSVTRPLRAGAGKLYNERLILQARIDSKITLQEMREEVQDRIASTMILYWRLYEARCRLIQARALVERGQEIERLVVARRGFDSGELEVSKVNARVARRLDALVERERDLRNLQTQLAAVVASDSLRSSGGLELIPLDAPAIVDFDLELTDLVINALNNRPDVRNAALDMESASLEISITRNELLPTLNAIAGGYLAGLNANNDMTRSFGDQFSEGRPGINAGLEYEVPYGRRASRSKNRAAHQRYLEMSERYRESVANVTAEVETASRNINAALASIQTKQQVLDAAANQEFLVRYRWETVGPDGRHAALMLEDLLDQQENRAAAEQEVLAAEISFILALIELQQSTGTLLTTEGIEPMKTNGTKVRWITVDPQSQPVNTEVQTEIQTPPAMEAMIETETGS